MNQMIHTCFSRVGHGYFDYFSINIITLNTHLHIIAYQIIRLRHRIVPALSRQKMLPRLSCKLTIHTRCNIGTDHSCLNRKGTAAAERIHKNTIFIPWCQHDQGRRQCL